MSHSDANVSCNSPSLHFNVLRLYLTLVNIGCLPYLNARPLLAWFEQHCPSGFTLSYATPSVLVEQLLSGDVDIALTSTFPTLQYPELHLLPGLGVTASGPVLSVRLLSKVPLRDIHSLALDCNSRSSVVLARIILANRYKVTPPVISHEPELDDMLAEADAAVIIGDRGLMVSGAGLLDIDLCQEWWELTGLPFYFAGWSSRDPDLLHRVAPIFQEACEYGLAHLTDICAEEADRRNIPLAICRQYLIDILRYRAGAAEMAGLEEFRRRALGLRLLPPPESSTAANCITRDGG